MAKFYVLCDDDCRYEGMTKEEILTAIEQALEQGYVSDPDGAVFSKIREIRAGGTAQLWVGTEAEFNAISPAPTVGTSLVRVGADGTLYLCEDDNSLVSMAAHLNSKENPHGVTAEQVGAAKADHTHTAAEVGAASKNHKHTAADVGALSTNGGTVTGELKATGNITVECTDARMIELARTVGGYVEGAGLYVNEEGCAQVVHKTNGGVVNAMLLRSSRTEFQKPVAVASGGTGATTAAKARENLGIYVQAEEPVNAPEGSIWIKLAE